MHERGGVLQLDKNQWFKHNYEALCAKLEQILQLKVGCPNFGPVLASGLVIPFSPSSYGMDITTRRRSLMGYFHIQM